MSPPRLKLLFASDHIFVSKSNIYVSPFGFGGGRKKGEIKDGRKGGGRGSIPNTEAVSVPPKTMREWPTMVAVWKPRGDGVAPVVSILTQLMSKVSKTMTSLHQP